MGSEKLSVPVSSTARRVIAVAIAATLLAVLAISTRPAPADAETITGVIPSECDSLIGPVPVDIPFSAENDVDEIEPGGSMAITLSGGFPEIVQTTTRYVDWSEGTWPLPAEVENVDGVSFSASPGWRPPGAAAAGEASEWEDTDPVPAGLEVVNNGGSEPGYVKVYFEGGTGTSPDPTTPGDIYETPAITITVTVNEEDTDYYLAWTTFSIQESSANTTFGTNEGPCLPDDPGQVLNSVTQVGSPDPTTTTTSTTTSSTTSSTTTSSTTSSTTSTTARPQTGTTTRPSYTG